MAGGMSLGKGVNHESAPARRAQRRDDFAGELAGLLRAVEEFEGTERWLREALALRRYFPANRRVATLDWQPEGCVRGMDACNGMIAASAVDLVIAQLHRNERGVPANPTTLLLDGVWREAGEPVADALDAAAARGGRNTA